MVTMPTRLTTAPSSISRTARRIEGGWATEPTGRPEVSSAWTGGACATMVTAVTPTAWTWVSGTRRRPRP